MAPRTDVLVVGGGVIGTACAYYLTQRGVRVTLIDKGPIGFGCSYGNAGLIGPSHGLPLPMPGALRQALGWMLRPDSPLYIKPRLSWQLARWLLRFLRHANERHLQYAAEVLVGMARQSLALFERLAEEEDVAAEMGFQKRGVLYVCNSEAGLDAVRHEADVVGALGVLGRVLDEAAVRRLEPAITGPVVGATYFEHEADAEPLQVVQTLTRLAERQGATVLADTELIDIERNGRQIEAVRTTHGRLTAEQYIIATGSWTPPLTRALNLRVPIQAGRATV